MANTIGWGQGAVNNTIGWGKASINNSIGYGVIEANSWSPETNLTGGTGFVDSQSFLYDGIDDYMQSTSTFDTLDNLTDFTISFWIKPTTLTGHNTILRLDNGSGYLLFFIRNNSGQLDASFNVGSSFTRSSTNLVAGTWTHVALQFNGSSIQPDRYL